MRNEPLHAVVAGSVLALCLGPIGISAFVLGFVHGDAPCVLCWAQRTSMILIALTGLFILRFGPRPRYIGMGILIAAHGLYMSARHSALHLARDVGQGFSIEILGAHTYVWSGFIFWCSVTLMGLLLVLTRDGEARAATRELGLLGRTATAVFLVAVGGNVVQAFAATGPPPFMGQGDPVRFSFNPRHWVWSLEEWAPAPISWRGRWGIEKPDAAGLDPDWRRGPLVGLRPLPVKRRLSVGAGLNGAITDAAYDAASDRFLLTTEAHGVYLMDGALGKVLRYTVLDPGYSVDLGQLTGAAFLDDRTLMLLGHNKSFVVLEPSDTADALENYRFFLESFDQFSELRRGRFATVRARMNYVMALGYGSETDSLYTLSVPNRRYKTLVVSRFARADLQLSEEFLPHLAEGSGLAVEGESRGLQQYVITGIAVEGRWLYALSAAYNTLLLLDLEEEALVAAFGVEGPQRPTGLALHGSELYIVDPDGGVSVVDRPEPPSTEDSAAPASEAG